MGLNQVPKEVRALYQKRELGPDQWLQWQALPQTVELVKALRLAEAALRYTPGTSYDIYSGAQADGLLKAIQIIEKFTRTVDTGEE